MRYAITNKAASYVGVKESPANSNNVIFNTDYYGHSVSGTSYPWCCAFCWDIFRMCGAGSYFYGGGKTASCTTLLNYYKSKHPDWVKTDLTKAEPGDIVLFQFTASKKKQGIAGHVGIFDEKVNTSKFYAVEGNTSSGVLGSQDNGGCVARRLRYLSQVIAIIHIPYASDLDYSIVFDAAYYSNNYGDLKSAFGTDATKLLNHFKQYGMKEGRQACSTFNVQKYKSYYTDLQKAFGDDLPSYYKHYMQYGKTEGRKTI